MNRRLLNFFYTVAVGAMVGLAGCERLIEVNPKQSVDASIALGSKEGIEAALISVYARLQAYQQYGRDYLALSEALSDNAVHSGNSSHLANESANTRGYHFDSWQTGYYAINQANLILDALANSSYDEAWTSTIYAQVYFLRVLFYHNLARAYAYDPTAIVDEYNRGGVPLMLVGVDDVSKIGSLKRPSIDAVYVQLYDDLDKAYFHSQRAEGLAGPHKVSQAAISALHSRIALYRGDYETAVAKADRALEETNASFSTREDFVNDWRRETHPESIFEIKFNVNENVGADRSLRATYTSRAFYDDVTYSIQAVVMVNPELYALYGDGDVRKGLIRFGVGNNSDKHEMYKFISKNGTKDLDNVPVIRVSEVYLNRAEAYYQLEEFDKALDDVNRIRTRAGLAEVDFSGAALFDEILLQRRLELAFEGHRWFDLKRNGLDVIKATGNVPFNDYRILAPIPARETNADTALDQNYNY